MTGLRADDRAEALLPLQERVVLLVAVAVEVVDLVDAGLRVADHLLGDEGRDAEPAEVRAHGPAEIVDVELSDGADRCDGSIEPGLSLAPPADRHPTLGRAGDVARADPSRELATMPVPSEADYCAKGGNFGPHNLWENRPGAFQSSRFIFATYHN